MVSFTKFNFLAFSSKTHFWKTTWTQRKVCRGILQHAVLAELGHPDKAIEYAEALPKEAYLSAGGNGHSLTNTIWYYATRPYTEPIKLDNIPTPSPASASNPLPTPKPQNPKTPWDGIDWEKLSHAIHAFFGFRAASWWSKYLHRRHCPCLQCPSTA